MERCDTGGQFDYQFLGSPELWVLCSQGQNKNNLDPNSETVLFEKLKIELQKDLYFKLLC